MNLLLFLILCLVWGLVVLFFHHFRLWIFYYIIGSVGLAMLLIYLGRSILPIEQWLEMSTANNVHNIATFFGVQTRIFSAAPGAILVLVIPQGQGWTMLEINIECSGLLEASVLIGLLAMYPSQSLLARFVRIIFGIAATYLGNLIRVLLIVIVLAYVGKDTLFLSHTLIGRIIFFVFVVIIFWLSITWPTLRQIRANLLTQQAK